MLAMLILVPARVWGHASFALHRADMYEVLGVEESRQVDGWLHYISSSMIDNYKGEPRDEYGGLCFYDFLKTRFEGFKCQHRLLFHWGYNARPWNKELERKIERLPWSENKAEVDSFWNTLRYEQRMRNRIANAMTEDLFGLAHGGKEARLANALISIVYDVHIIGDYMTDNRNLRGLQEMGSVVGDLINALRRIDAEAAKPLVKELQTVSNARYEVTAGQALEKITAEQVKADAIMAVLKRLVPVFLKEHGVGDKIKISAKDVI